MIRAKQPFTFVKKHDLTGMIQSSLNPQYKGFSATTAKREIMKHFKLQKIKLKNILHTYNGRFCLTSDAWASQNKG
jgi:hypothetical protein